MTIITPCRNATQVKGMQLALAKLYPDARVITIIDELGRGKGWAIRQGIKDVVGMVIFIDGDMDIKPRMISRLLPFLTDYDIVVGTKSLNMLPFRRKAVTFLSRIYIRLMFGLDVDTQTGIKAFNIKFPEWSTDGFAFDIELLYKAKKLGYSMIEVPIEAVITKQMPLRAIWKTLTESIRIRLSL
jgi:dolichyl-phosphate beta-glucosyltransferase